MDWLDFLAVQGTLKSLLQHHSSNASILRHSAFFTVQLSHPYMTTGKTIALTRWTLVGKAMSLLLNMLSRLVITCLPRSKRLLISWLQSPSAVIYNFYSLVFRFLIRSPWKFRVFQICWHIECSTFTASSFRMWNSSTGNPSPPLALFIVMLSKDHLAYSKAETSLCQQRSV